MGDMKPEYSRNIRLVADFPITGKVVDTGGKPVAGVAIAVDRIFELSDPRWKLMHPAIDAGNPFLMTRPQCDTNNWFTPLYPTAFRMIPPAVTDSEGRFRLAGTGGDRAIRLQVSGPGIRSDTVSVLTRDDVADFTRAIRTKYPRTPRTGGYFYPPRAMRQKATRVFGSLVRLRRSTWTPLALSPALCATRPRANRSPAIAWGSPRARDMPPLQPTAAGVIASSMMTTNPRS